MVEAVLGPVFWQVNKVGYNCYEPETKTQFVKWILPFEDLPTKVKKSRSQGKKMIVSFLDGGMDISWWSLPIFQQLSERIKELLMQIGMLVYVHQLSREMFNSSTQQAGSSSIITTPYGQWNLFNSPNLANIATYNLRRLHCMNPEHAVAAYETNMEENGFLHNASFDLHKCSVSPSYH